MNTLGMRLIAAIIDSKDSSQFVTTGIRRELLTGQEAQVFDFVSDYIKSYAAVPSREVVNQKFAVAGVSLPVAADPPKFYADEVRRRFINDQLVEAFNQCAPFVSSAGINSDPEKALSILTEKCMSLSVTNKMGQILDFREAGPLVLKNYHEAQYGTGHEPIYFGWDSLDKESAGARPGDLISIIGRPAAGKAQPLDEPVKTVTGWKSIGDLMIGDELASIDGAPSHVTGIHPQGDLQVFEIKFKDGRTTRCCKDHLWEVFYRDWDAPRVVSTKDLMSMLGKKRYQRRLSVPVTSGHFGHTNPLPLDPWLLGYLLGNGCFRTSLKVSCSDPEAVDRMSSCLPPEYSLVKASGVDWRITHGVKKRENELATELKSLGLWEHKSVEKFIPESYLLADRPRRVKLLQGLMDSDGWVDNGSPNFATSSPRLSRDVQSLVRSLGGVCRVIKRQTTHNPSYRMVVCLQKTNEAFWLPRKKQQTRETHSHSGRPSTLRNVIESVEPIGTEPCQCITVSHPRRLYLTNDYVVTHNTFLSLSVALHNWIKQRKVVVFLSMEMLPEILAMRATAMYSHVNLSYLQKGQLSTPSFEKVKASLTTVHTDEVPFYIIDGNLTATVEDLWNLAQTLNPDHIIVDGAYLLSHPNPRMTRFDRVAENSRLLKSAVATNLGVPVTCSWQFNREAAKKAKVKKGGDKGDLEDIGFADEIGQLSSLAMGLYQPDSVETLHQRQIQIIKGRNGECSGFNINWDFRSMDFSEVKAQQIQQLNYI